MDTSKDSRTRTEDRSQQGQSKYPYRSVKALPFELREHCVIYFEEQLCIRSHPFYALVLQDSDRCINA